MENRSDTNRSNRKKGMLALVMLAVVCLSVLAGGTYAYFTVEETAYNVITMGTLDMELVEETTGGEPWPENGMSGMMPGMNQNNRNNRNNNNFGGGGMMPGGWR